MALPGIVSMPAQALQVKAAALAMKCPKEWKEFMEALQVYVNQRKDEMVSSPPDLVMVAQGRAREASTFLRCMDDCVVVADQLSKRK